MSAPALRRLAVCADDYGLSMPVSCAIVELAGRGRLNHVSCLTNGPCWPAAAPLLRSVEGKAEAGLHFNLTEGRPLSRALAGVWPQLPDLPTLILAAHLGRLPLDAIRAEWAAQWVAFVDHAGEEPRFVDGHQHVHHLPGVRELMLAWLGPLALAPAVRNTGRVLGPGSAVKRWAIRQTGGAALQRSLRSRGLRHNPVLLGAYDFESTDYRGLMRQWLQHVPPEGALLFCHPGAEVPGDTIGSARAREYAYLASGEFGTDLAEAGVTLGAAWSR
jgi:hypothetical protein